MSNNISQITVRFRQGIWGLPLAGFLFLIGFFFRGQPIPNEGPDLFAQIVTAPSYLIGWSFLIVGMLPLIFGLASLYGYLATMQVERRALWAMLLSVAGTALQIGFYTITSFVAVAVGEQYLAGQSNAVDLMGSLLGGSFAAYLGVSTLLVIIGLILFATAIGKSDTLPRWAGILLPLHYLALLAPAFQLRGNASLIVESLGAVILLAAGVGLARAVNK